MPLDPRRWSHTAKLVAAFATLYVVWGTTYLAIRIGLQASLPPAIFAGLRGVSAGVILLGFSAARGRTFRVSSIDLRTIIVVGLLLLVGGQYGTFLAEQYVPSGLSALLVALLPLWIAFSESLLPGMDRPSALGWAGLILGFSGLGLLMWPHLGDIAGSKTILTGIALQIVATWLWTGGSVLSKRRPVKVDAIVATGIEMLAAGIVCLGIAAVAGEWSRVIFTPTGIGALAYLVVFGSCIAFTAFVWALRHAPASKVMTYAFVNPVVAVFLGWLILDEPVDTWTLAGMAVIVAGVALATLAPTRPGRAVRTTA